MFLVAYFEKFSRSLSSSGNVFTYSEYLTRETAHLKDLRTSKDRSQLKSNKKWIRNRSDLKKGKEVMIFMYAADMINKIKFSFGFKKCAQ